MQMIRGCADCVLAKDGVDRCLVASMCEKPVNPAHGCSWKTPIKHKAICTNADRLRNATTNQAIAELLDEAVRSGIGGGVKDTYHRWLNWLGEEVNSNG